VDNNNDASVSQKKPPFPPPQSNNDCIYDCQTDRLGHKTPLFTGQALCNHQYRFGLTHEGVFQWHDCDTHQTHVFYTPTTTTTTTTNNQVSYFEMQEDAAFQLYSYDNQVVWKKASTRQPKIHFSAHCLSRPLLDCPYLHLHKSGDVVLNWIDDNNGKWVDRNIKRCYNDLF
jgi:hypothetical protein